MFAVEAHFWSHGDSPWSKGGSSLSMENGDSSCSHGSSFWSHCDSFYSEAWELTCSHGTKKSHPGVMGLILELWRLILESLRIPRSNGGSPGIFESPPVYMNTIPEPRRLTLEPLRLTLEPWRLILKPSRLIWSRKGTS